MRRNFTSNSILIGVSAVVATVGVAAWAAGRHAAAGPRADRATSTDSEPDQKRLDEEVAVLPEGEVRITDDAYPAVYALMQGQLSAQFGEGPVPGPSNRIKSAQMVQTTQGILTVYELGDGAVRLLATAFSGDEADAASPVVGPAFAATITKDGIEVTSVDEYALAEFVGEPTALAGTDGDGRAAANNNARLQTVIGPCENRGGTMCCFVLTDTQACVCCFSLAPGSTPVCNCAPVN